MSNTDKNLKKESKNRALHKKLKNKYQVYIRYCKENLKYSKKSKEPYFVIYCNFGELLSDISNDALRLYLYLGFNIDYKKGFLLKNENEICEDTHFKKNKINKCLLELENKNLIYIKKDENAYEYIFIIPYNMDNKSNYSIIELEKIYKDWIETCKKTIEPFFLLHKKFMDHWCFLSSEPIKLYIYFGIHMDKRKGFFYRSLDTIANDLDVSKRSISKWFKELEEIKLIKRQQLFVNRSSSTYMIPLIDINEHKKQSNKLEYPKLNKAPFQYSDIDSCWNNLKENKENNGGCF